MLVRIVTNYGVAEIESYSELDLLMLQREMELVGLGAQFFVGELELYPEAV